MHREEMNSNTRPNMLETTRRSPPISMGHSDLTADPMHTEFGLNKRRLVHLRVQY